MWNFSEVKIETMFNIKNKWAAANSTYPKVAVQWLNQALCFYQSLCLVDSESFRNRHLRVAAKRYLLFLRPTQPDRKITTFVPIL